MKKYGIIIFILIIGLVTVLNVNTWIGKIDKSYSLALSNIEALANPEGPTVGEDGSIKLSSCYPNHRASGGADAFYYKCPGAGDYGTAYRCPGEPIKAHVYGSSRSCYH